MEFDGPMVPLFWIIEIATLESLESPEVEGLLYVFTGSVRFRMLAPRILHRQVAPVSLDLTRPRNQMVDLAQVPHGHREMVGQSVSCRTLLIYLFGILR